MRVAFNTLSDALTSQLAFLNGKQLQLQSQAASGKRIAQLSDDPTAMGQVLDSQVQASQQTQYRSNIASLQQVATSTGDALQSLQTIAQRAGELATLAGGAKNPQDLQDYALELNQLIQQGVTVMNSQYQGAYLFGGTASGQPPFVAATDANGNVTGVTYQGNESVLSAEVGPGATVSAQLLGANSSGSGPAGVITDSRSGADFFNHLISLRDDLQAGNTTAITGTDNAALTKDEDNITSQMAANGVVQSQLSTADTLAAARSSALQNSISQASDADLAQTLTQLSATQTAFQAALQSGASLLSVSQSLLDYVQ